MHKQSYKLYFIFLITFTIFHLTGVLSGRLPYILNALITLTVVLISLSLFDKWYSKDSLIQVLSNLGFHKTSFIKLTPGIWISMFLLLLYPLFYFVFGIDVYLNKSWFLNLIGLFLTGGLAEEMFFRGFVFRNLRGNMSFKKAVLTSMALFAAAHLLMFTYMEWSVALFSTILAVAVSVPMAYLFERADNTVWSPAIVHTIIRTIGLVVTAPEEDFLQMTLMWMAGCMIIPLVVVISYKDFRITWKTN